MRQHFYNWPLPSHPHKHPRSVPSSSFLDLFYLMYVHHTWKRVGFLANDCRRQGQKNDAKRQQTTQKCQNWLKTKGKNDAKIRSEIRVALVFVFFSRYNVHICTNVMYIHIGILFYNRRAGSVTSPPSGTNRSTKWPADGHEGS